MFGESDSSDSDVISLTLDSPTRDREESGDHTSSGHSMGTNDDSARHSDHNDRDDHHESGAAMGGVIFEDDDSSESRPWLPKRNLMKEWDESTSHLYRIKLFDSSRDLHYRSDLDIISLMPSSLMFSLNIDGIIDILIRMSKL